MQQASTFQVDVTVPKGGLIEWCLGGETGLASICPRLKARLLNLLDTCYVPDEPCPFRENPDPDAPARIDTLVWALFCFLHLGSEGRVRNVRDSGDILEKIDAYYDPMRMIYQDSNTQEAGVWGRWRLHNDGIMRLGLSLMGVEARPRVKGLAALQHFPWAPQPGQDLQAWLEMCWDHDPRAGTKEIMQYVGLYTILTGEVLDEHVLSILSFLAARRDPETGYIGIPKSGDLGWAMRGHRNNIFGYIRKWGLREPLEAQLQVMETTLSLQHVDGLFHDRGMCANMDAIELLVEYYLQTGHYREQVLKACRRCVRGVFQKLYIPVGECAGGFSWKFEDVPDDVATEGYTSAWLVNGTAFVLNMLRYWQAIDPVARQDLGRALDDVGAARYLS